MVKKRYLWGVAAVVAVIVCVAIGRQGAAVTETLSEPGEAEVKDPAGQTTVIAEGAATHSSAANRYNSRPVGAHTLTHRAEVPEGDVVEVFQRLQPRAEAGDADAALAIYLKLRECYQAINEELPEEAIRMYEEVGAASSLLQMRLAQLEDCENTSTLSTDASQWLSQAAEAGVEEAQLIYATNPTPILGRTEDMLRDPEAVQRYKTKSMQYLTTLAGQGSVEGMLALARTFNSGLLTDRNVSKSYAYYKATNLALPGTLSPRFIEAMSQQVPPGEREEAERMASAIYQRCCMN